MSSVFVARAANASFAPSYEPVALFIGGTSGIGQSMAEILAGHLKGKAHIVICGRNKKAADSVLASLPKPTKEFKPEPMREFVHCDATTMSNVHATTTDLLARLPKIDFLILSIGIVNMQGRSETEEGIDKKLALDYYARWKFIRDLMPLLRKAKGTLI
jgi:NAD(P)-dependent dehydrogenase (short-subunit alcohol dehydrogenase family)